MASRGGCASTSGTPGAASQRTRSHEGRSRAAFDEARCFFRFPWPIVVERKTAARLHLALPRPGKLAPPPPFTALLLYSDLAWFHRIESAVFQA
jgi:hypothetical protein